MSEYRPPLRDINFVLDHIVDIGELRTLIGAIAKITGLSETNVGTVLHRTVRSLRAAWDEPPAANQGA